LDEPSSLGAVSKHGCFFWNARARNTHVEATLHLSCPAQAPCSRNPGRRRCTSPRPPARRRRSSRRSPGATPRRSRAPPTAAAARRPTSRRPRASTARPRGSSTSRRTSGTRPTAAAARAGPRGRRPPVRDVPPEREAARSRRRRRGSRSDERVPRSFERPAARGRRRADAVAVARVRAGSRIRAPRRPRDLLEAHAADLAPADAAALGGAGRRTPAPGAAPGGGGGGGAGDDGDDGGWADGAAAADGALAHLGAGCDVDVVADPRRTAARRSRVGRDGARADASGPPVEAAAARARGRAAPRRADARAARSSTRTSRRRPSATATCATRGPSSSAAPRRAALASSSRLARARRRTVGRVDVGATEPGAADVRRRRPGAPVGARAGAALSWPARSAARRDALLRRFGAAALAAAAVPYAGLFGEAEATVALGDFAAGLPRGGAARLAAFLANASADAAAPPAYVFGNGGAAEALVAALLPPPEGLPAWLGAYGEAFSLAAPQFYLGPPLSGAPAHFHGAAINGLAFGAKLWRLAPPWRARAPRRSRAARRRRRRRARRRPTRRRPRSSRSARRRRARGCVEINQWNGRVQQNFKPLYLGQIEVDSADFWTDRSLSSSSRSPAEELVSKHSNTLTLKSG